MAIPDNDLAAMAKVLQKSGRMVFGARWVTTDCESN
jgi:hypothetical protein